MAHRLAWLLHYGDWPSDQLDHVNGVRDDNRIINLREASSCLNGQNKVASFKGSEIPFLGVSRWKDKFKAEVTLNKKRHYLGLHSTPEAAHEAYLKAKQELHPFSERAKSV